MKFCNCWGQIPAEGNSSGPAGVLGQCQEGTFRSPGLTSPSWCHQEGFRITERCCCGMWEQYRALLVCHTQRGLMLVGLGTVGSCPNPQWLVLKIEFEIIFPLTVSSSSPAGRLYSILSPLVQSLPVFQCLSPTFLLLQLCLLLFFSFLLQTHSSFSLLMSQLRGCRCWVADSWDRAWPLHHAWCIFLASCQWYITQAEPTAALWTHSHAGLFRSACSSFFCYTLCPLTELIGNFVAHKARNAITSISVTSFSHTKAPLQRFYFTGC